ncbi:MAG: hypothetical protein WC294_07690 [Methanoregula sp.]|jgi:hypothetical protein
MKRAAWQGSVPCSDNSLFPYSYSAIRIPESAFLKFFRLHSGNVFLPRNNSRFLVFCYCVPEGQHEYRIDTTIATIVPATIVTVDATVTRALLPAAITAEKTQAVQPTQMADPMKGIPLPTIIKRYHWGNCHHHRCSLGKALVDTAAERVVIASGEGGFCYCDPESA